MLDTWLNWTIDCACSQSGIFWSGSRKIAHHQLLTINTLDDTIGLNILGYTQNKITRLQSQYFVPEAIEAANYLHGHNITRKKYASASFHCYGHMLKATYENRSSRGSVMGPCIQSVVLTLRPHERRTAVDVFYRTTEAFKKFPADLIWLRQNVFPLIVGQDQYPLVGFNFHFVNVTSHPMYLATILPLVPDAVATMELLRNRDALFWRHAGVWLCRYLIGGATSRGIDGFAQAKRTADTARLQLSGDVGDRLVKYLFHHRQAFKPKNTRFDHAEIEQAFHDAFKRVS